MARVTYGVLAAAAVTLVAGFFVRTTSAPLIASLVFSGAVLLLILFGWSRRIRSGIFDEEFASEDDVDIEELEPETKTTRKPKVTGGEDVDDVIEPVRTRRRISRPGSTPGTATKPERKRIEREKPEPAKAKTKPKPSPPKPKGAKRVVVIPGASRYHRPSCRFAKGDKARNVTETTAIARGYVACDTCKP